MERLVLEATRSQQVPQGRRREDADVPRWLAHLAEEAAGVRRPHAYLGEEGLGAQEQRNAVDPGGEVGGGKDKATARLQYPQQIFNEGLGVEDVLDDFPRPDHVDASVRQRK